MKTLIPLSDFVLEKSTNVFSSTRRLNLIISYAEFLRQPLLIGNFVPVDEGGNYLQEPYHADGSEKIEQYKKAKERILFMGFYLNAEDQVSNDDLKLTIYLDSYQFMIEGNLGVSGGDLCGNTLEALAFADLGLTPTPSALKAIGLNE